MHPGVRRHSYHFYLLARPISTTCTAVAPNAQMDRGVLRMQEDHQGTPLTGFPKQNKPIAELPDCDHEGMITVEQRPVGNQTLLHLQTTGRECTSNRAASSQQQIEMHLQNGRNKAPCCRNLAQLLLVGTRLASAPGCSLLLAAGAQAGASSAGTVATGAGASRPRAEGWPWWRAQRQHQRHWHRRPRRSASSRPWQRPGRPARRQAEWQPWLAGRQPGAW
jgi:hypothetical protein